MRPAIEPSQLLQIIRERRSLRRYAPQPVPRHVVEDLLEAARWAPSAHNRQPWRFVVITAAETKRQLALAMGERLRADLTRDGAPAEVIQADAGNSIARLTNAPVLIVACLTMRDMDPYPDERRRGAERVMAVQSVALAVQNLLLMAHAHGLGACWMCAPLFVPETVREVLALERDWEPQALVTLGYPAESKLKGRMPLETLVKFFKEN